MIYECYECGTYEAANFLHELGLPIIPCRDVTPTAADWRVREYSAIEIHREFAEDHDLNLGLVLGPRYGLIEIAIPAAEGRESHREFYELLDGKFHETPTFESKHACHHIFAWDKRLALLSVDELRFKSFVVRIGAGEAGAYTMLPPSIVDGVEREWRLTIDDYDGGIGRLPNYAVDKLIASVQQEGHQEAA